MNTDNKNEKQRIAAYLTKKEVEKICDKTGETKPGSALRIAARRFAEIKGEE